jgi:hypothetical protein
MTLAVGQTTSPASGPEQAIAALLAEDGPIRQAWDREPVVVAAPELASLLPTADTLLGTSLLRPPFLTVLDDGAQVPLARYCRPEHIINVSGPEYIVDRGRLDALLASGTALKLNRLELWSPPITALAKSISVMSGRQVKVWGFLSPLGQMLVPSHRDPGHVMAVQVAGSKAWTLSGPRPEGAWSAMSTPVPGQPTSVVLTPGDLLYMPYGYAHGAAAETASSFHISFSLEGTTAGELRHRIVKALLDRLDGADSTEVRPENVAHILSGVVDAMEQVKAQVEELPHKDLRGIYGGRTAAVIGDLLGVRAEVKG